MEGKEARRAAAGQEMKKLILGWFVAAFLCGPAFSKDLDTGNELYPMCKRAAQVTGGRNSTELAQLSFCVGTVSTLLSVSELLNESLRFCPPDGVTNGQAIRVVVNYMERNPQIRHQKLHQIGLVAMREAWPCRPR